MNKLARFLYHCISILPYKSKKLRNFLDLLHFYYKGNSLTVICKNGEKIDNPIKHLSLIHLKASGRCSNNKVIIYEQQKQGFFIEFNFWNGCNNTVEIGHENMICMVAHIQGNNGHAIIGNNTHICESTLYMYCSGKTTFTIGDNNLFSENITFWAGEGHSVVDSKNKTVTNIGGNITIGNNNWIGMNVCFLKRAKIGNGCIVGYGSILGKDFSKNDHCIIAGNPAQIVKQDILWTEKEPWNYNGELYR